MSNRLNEPNELLRECPSFEAATELARQARDTLDMPTAVRASAKGWSVFVPPGTAYELNNPEEPESDEARYAKAAYETLRSEVLDEEDDLDRSNEEGWVYSDKP